MYNFQFIGLVIIKGSDSTSGCCSPCLPDSKPRGGCQWLRKPFIPSLGLLLSLHIHPL